MEKFEKKDIVIAILIGVIIILCISILVVLLTQGEDKPADDEVTDATKFKSEYTKVSDDNVFVYSSLEEIIDILEGGTGVIYLGFPECSWCQAYVPLLDEVAKENDIDKIYYYDILEDRKNNTDNYQKVVELLEEQLLDAEEGNKRIYVPDVTIVKDGEIIGHDNESSVVTEEDGTPEEYWTEEKKDALKARYEGYFAEYNSNLCTSCNE